jgi:hypothetical protein
MQSPRTSQFLHCKHGFVSRIYACIMFPDTFRSAANREKKMEKFPGPIKIDSKLPI